MCTVRSSSPQRIGDEEGVEDLGCRITQVGPDQCRVVDRDWRTTRGGGRTPENSIPLRPVFPSPLLLPPFLIPLLLMLQISSLFPRSVASRCGPAGQQRSGWMHETLKKVHMGMTKMKEEDAS